jgi:penicillin amidase
VQLDDRALFLERWRTLLLDSIGPSATAAQQEFRNLVDQKWSGRASPDSVAYRLVKEFRLTFVRRVMTSLTAPAIAVDPAFDYTRLLRGEGPVWQIVDERPLHLLDPKYTTWDEAILDAVDFTIAQLTEGGRRLSDRTWGEANTAEIRHPLAAAIPLFGRYLNMPADPLPGDVYTPRASTPRTGPRSEWSSRPAARAKASSNSQPGRAVIHCRRTMAINIARGSTANRRRFFRAQRYPRCS